MYRFYRLYGGDPEIIHVVYSRQDSAKKFSSMKRNAKLGMQGDIYDYMRTCKNEISLMYIGYFLYPMKNPSTDNLEEAKIIRIDLIKGVTEKTIKEFTEKIHELEYDNQECLDEDLSPKNNYSQVIEKNNEKIEEFNKKIKLLK